MDILISSFKKIPTACLLFAQRAPQTERHPVIILMKSEFWFYVKLYLEHYTIRCTTQITTNLNATSEIADASWT